MVCQRCGQNVPNGTRFCHNCGADMLAAPVGGAAPVYKANPIGGAGFSTWDGGVVDTVINSIITSLIMSCSCGIAAPWAICYMTRFIASHTIIDGKRLKFTGDGADLFGNWIKWFLLTVVTCGIYGFWVAPRLYQWIASNVHFED